MKIVLLTAGAGPMYCGSCLHGNALAAALRAAGEDAILAPLYTPIRTDDDNLSIDRVAFGGINVYLQQHSALFRHTPWWLDRWLARPALLRFAGRHAAGVRPEQLGQLTVSVLRGEEGRQRKELQKLIHWLRDEVRPDIVHLSNVLLAGLAREIGRQLGVPVVCTLSGEDLFLEKLPEPHRREALDVLRRRVGDLAGLTAMNEYYAGFMAAYLGAPRSRIEIIRPGVVLAERAAKPQATPRRLGYLARICPEKGLHLLAEALKQLANDPDVPPVRLLAAGYLDPAERPYLEEIRRGLAAAGLGERFEYVGEPTRAEKTALLQSLDVMSMPSVYPESKALPVLEAWACGVPVVVPAHGAFPELIADTGGGALCRPDDAASLAETLKPLLRSPSLAAEYGRRAQEVIARRYTTHAMAEQTIAWYQAVRSRQ